MSRNTLPEPLPKCPTHAVTMAHRPITRQSPEVQWCGVWFDCVEPRCQCSVLYPSRELKAQNAQMLAQGRLFQDTA